MMRPMNADRRALGLAPLVALVSAVWVSSAVSAQAEGPIRLGKVAGPSWSRVRAAVQVVLTRKKVSLATPGTLESGRVTGLVREVKGVLVADVSLLDASGRRRARAEFRGADGRSLAKDVKARFWSEFGDQVRALTASTVAEPTEPTKRKTKSRRRARPSSPAAGDEPRRRSKASTAARPSKTSGSVVVAEAPAASGAPRRLAAEAIRFRVGVGLFARDLSWVDDIFESLAGYQLGAAPAFRFDAAWFPGAHFESGPLSWVGLDVEAELPFAVESNRGGTTFPTAASAWRLGVLGRLPLDPVEFRLGAAFGERRFHLETSEEGFSVPDLPEVRYQTFGFRAGATVRIVDRVDVDLHGGWGFMLDAGAIGRGPWFPRSESHTASVGGGVAVHIDGGISAFGRFDWQGAYFNLRPEPGDARVAGGVLDQFYLASMGVAFAGR